MTIHHERWNRICFFCITTKRWQLFISQDITLKLPTIVLASCEDKMIVLKQLRNLVCLLGENVHVVLNSESHWTYIEQVSVLSSALSVLFSSSSDVTFTLFKFHSPNFEIFFPRLLSWDNLIISDYSFLKLVHLRYQNFVKSCYCTMYYRCSWSC